MGVGQLIKTYKFTLRCYSYLQTSSPLRQICNLPQQTWWICNPPSFSGSLSGSQNLINYCGRLQICRDGNNKK